MPILTHGAETLTRNKADIRRLIQDEMFWKYRRKNQEQKKTSNNHFSCGSSLCIVLV
jgi:hypothetical protein